MATVLLGDWDEIFAWLANVEKWAREAWEDIETSILEGTVEETKSAMRGNRVKPRAKPGDEVTTLIDTGDYAGALGVYKQQQRRYAGFPLRQKHKPSGLFYRQLFLIHRFGTDKMRPRPHLDKEFKKELKRVPILLRAKGFPIVKRKRRSRRR